MVRAILSVLSLFAVAGFVTAEEKKADTTVKGKFKSYKDDKLTILVGKAGAEKETTFPVAGDTKVDEYVGAARKSFLAKNTFTEVNENADVRVTLDPEKKIHSITVERNATGTISRGAFKSYKDGFLTIMVGKPGEEKETMFAIVGDTKVDEYVGRERKSFLAKNTFKELNENAEVTLTVNPDKKVTHMMIDRNAK